MDNNSNNECTWWCESCENYTIFRPLDCEDCRWAGCECDLTICTKCGREWAGHKVGRGEEE